jgi:hypothetical protein
MAWLNSMVNLTTVLVNLITIVANLTWIPS